MAEEDILLVLIQCELKAKYNVLTGRQLSAKGDLPILLTLAIQ